MSPSVTISTSNLAQALRAVTPFASRDVTLPGLCVVQLQAAPGILTATATDRYSIGHARQAATGALSRPRYLHRRDAKNLRDELDAYMEDRESGLDPVTITEHDDYLRVTFDPVTMHCVEPDAGKFPDVGAVLATLPVVAAAEGLHAPVSLSHRVLRPLLKAAEADPYNPPRLLFDGPRKPVRVEIGDWFIGAIMPVKLRGDEQPVPVEMPAQAEAVAR
ncbi:hypothetical protein [Micromonospora carbonacea]|uniref:Uncharacterized protein n=1 Tax=Micromonospora carbonacea TaxID=47853 RepID=A0A1C5AYV6_9ACTN|nr:hypothetical protein [Micromonospora carbonacea]SCF50388.1 hypothetical protein GA0070563_13113 [Micromonospora carbonacea]